MQSRFCLRPSLNLLLPHALESRNLQVPMEGNKEMDDPQGPPGSNYPTPWMQHERGRSDSLPILQNKENDKEQERGGGPKDGTFQGTMPSHTSNCLGLCSIIRLASLQPLKRWTEVSALEWEEEGAVFPLLQLTSSLLLSSRLDKYLHVYAAILVSFCLFTMLLLWTRHDTWHSTT